MRLWLIVHHDYGDITAWSEDTNIIEIDMVAQELKYLEGAYEEERDNFLDDIISARERGCGQACIEERLSVELVEIRHG